MIIITNTSAPRPGRVRLGYPTEPWIFARPGDTLLVTSEGPTITTTETVAAPAGDPPVIEGASPTAPTITIAEVGRHHFRVTTTSGETADVSVIACEPECFDRLPDRQQSGGEAVDKQRALAELARFDESFTGRAAELANKPLAQYGAG